MIPSYVLFKASYEMLRSLARHDSPHTTVAATKITRLRLSLSNLSVVEDLGIEHRALRHFKCALRLPQLTL